MIFIFDYNKRNLPTGPYWKTRIKTFEYIDTSVGNRFYYQSRFPVLLHPF